MPGVLRRAVDVLGCRCDLRARGRRPALGTEEPLDVNEVLARGRCVQAIVEGHSVPQVFFPKLIESGAPAACRSSGWCAPTTSIRSTRRPRRRLAGDVVKPVLRMS